MKMFLFILPAIILLISGCATGKARYQPLKVYGQINISDGEYLQYGKYISGEKTQTIYYVSRIETNSKYGPVLKNYSDSVRPNSSDILPSNYKDFSSLDIISLHNGSLIGQIVDNSKMTNKYKYMNDPSKLKGEFYHSYQVENGYMKINYKVLKEKNIQTGEIQNIELREKVDTNYPMWDIYTFSMFSYRFLNIFKPGIMYLVMPSIIKEPVPCYIKVIDKEKIKIGIGEFDAVKARIVSSDPFLCKLLGSYSDNTTIWFENSERKELLKMESVGITIELEKISNVISKESETADN